MLSGIVVAVPVSLIALPPLLPTAERFALPPRLLSSRTTLPVRRSDPPILYLLYRGDQSRRIPRACAARNERSPVLSVFPSVYPEDRSTGRPPCPLLGPFSWDLPSLPPPSPCIRPPSTFLHRFSPLFFARLAPSLFDLATVDRDVRLHPDTRASNCTFLPRFIWHWHEIDSFFLILSIVYFGKTIDSFLFRIIDCIINSIKLLDIHERRHSCTYLIHSYRYNNVALLNRSM